ncbi:T6SS effector amidase Tae4 family protein [Brenneria sp. g21c3]|uniref:T6SS effector amidase Tae4 family protein n=1 Tax=Brenneria sp. g21c3 TaxID=3093893 RepID=UPI002E9AED6C|nr:T6SS effector amidase Tae4 family protein [Brenneria sp. g21c3]
MLPVASDHTHLFANNPENIAFPGIGFEQKYSKAYIRHNSSLRDDDMGVIFADLWNAHPEVKGDENPCRRKDGHKAFDDQCAIRIGTALARCGYDVSNSGQNFVGSIPKVKAISYELKNSPMRLNSAPIPGIFPAVKVDVKNFEQVLGEQTGIIFFKDYWHRRNESFANRSGDHIDLWNSSRLTLRSSYFRIQWGFSWEGQFSDFFDAKEIWFWKVI